MPAESTHTCRSLSLTVCREAVESELVFAGLVVMQNRLKTQTTPVIATLSQANIRTVMITGRSRDTDVRSCDADSCDHVLTLCQVTTC